MPRKTDPAAMAVDILCEEPGHPDVAQRVSRLSDLLIRLAAEPEGKHAARWHLPRVLALALAANSGLFEREFVRCVVEHDVEEAFGSLPADVAVRWLRLRTGSSVTTDELVALWHWMAASPGSIECKTGGEVASLIAERLAEDEAIDDADQVQRWLAAAVPADRDGRHAPDDETQLTTQDERPTPRIENVSPRWFSPWWGNEENRVLREFLADGGDAAWLMVCTRLSQLIARSTNSFAHEFLLVGEGLCDLRPSLPRADAVDLAMHHLSEKVRFQAEPPERPRELALDGRSRVDVLVRLLARGIDIGDVETIRRTLRSLGVLARRSGTAPVVVCEMLERLRSEDVRSVICGLSVLRRSDALPQDALDEVRRMQNHPDAWCRWLACSLLGNKPTWSPLRSVVIAPGIIASDAGPERTEVGSVYYAGTTSVREVYVRKINALVDIDEDTLRSWLETELRALPDLDERHLGWHRHRGPRLTSDRAVFFHRGPGPADPVLALRVLNTAAERSSSPKHGRIWIGGDTRALTDLENPRD